MLFNIRMVCAMVGAENSSVTPSIRTSDGKVQNRSAKAGPCVIKRQVIQAKYLFNKIAGDTLCPTALTALSAACAIAT